VPVPRRFDRSLPERDSTRINERIRVPEVRLIGPDGDQVGILKTVDALRYAQERDLDLVEVAPDSKPPVCRVLDYSKYKYEQAQRQKAARKHQQQITIREIKFRPKIAQHDYDTKKGHVTRFLNARDKVKVTIMFRGREVAHPERGEIILNRLAEELEELAIVEQRPTQDGRNMTMMLGPVRAKGDDTPAPVSTTSKPPRKPAAAPQPAAAKSAPAPAQAAPAPAAEPARPAPAEAAAPEPPVKGPPAKEPEPVKEPEPAPEPVRAPAPEPEAGAGKPDPEPEPAAVPDGPVASAQPAGGKTKVAAKAAKPAAPAKAAKPKAEKPAKGAAAPKAKTPAKPKAPAKAKAPVK